MNNHSNTITSYKVLAAISLATLLNACGGGGSDSSSPTLIDTNNSDKEVSITVTSTAGIIGTAYTLTWTLDDSNNCFISGAIEETVTSDGAATITPQIIGAQETIITCDSQSASVIVNVIPEMIDIPDTVFSDALTRLGYTITDGKMSAEDALSINSLCITSKADSYGLSDLNNTSIFENTHVLDSGVRCAYTDDYITDITGLEYFLNLETMRLEHQQFEIIDLSLLQNLFFLSLWGNPLTSLDVTHNTEITHLGLSETSLTSINTSHLTKLLEAGFQHSYNAPDLPYTLSNGTTVYGFSSLDFSKNQQLQRVYLHGNPLTDFGISQNSKLQELWARGTSITSLDLSGLENLRYVILSDSQNLNFLNLSGVDNNTVPYRLYLDGCPSLEEVIVHNADDYLTAIQNQEIIVDNHITFIE